MIPCLYDSSETEYADNGIGKLSDCQSCVVTEKRNGSYELKMEYPAEGIHADYLQEGNIIRSGALFCFVSRQIIGMEIAYIYRRF